MDKCNVCGREQKQIGTLNFKIGDNESSTAPYYNIQLLTYIKGKWICTRCMDLYHKIEALKYDMDFSCGGTEYFADGRNLD